MDTEHVVMMLKFIGILAAVMGVIWLCCFITPKLARKIEKKLPADENGDGDNKVNPEDYTVQGPFDPQKLDEYDLNYKIYNKDIYGVDFKHGKKKNEKMVDAITSMDEDFAKWYTDICKKAELIEYTSVKGCMVIRPYGYAIWENIQKDLDGRFKELGHENVCMPMFIPESLLQKEKDHVEGFAPEVAWVTHGGSEKLEDRLCVRPTSETLFCEHYANIVHSYRDLPKLYNQWVSVVSWEKTTRPFLRSREFLWQEGHTIHETAAGGYRGDRAYAELLC